MTTDPDYSRYYDLERYLFNEVSRRYRLEGSLSAFDFFCIVIWKANRSKSKIAKRLSSKRPALEEAVRDLTAAVAAAPDAKTRLAVMVTDWGFRLPMASAVLSVLYPEEFTVYDVRVCDVLGDFHKAQNRTKLDGLWRDYCSYVEAVRAGATAKDSLREKDRYLWGKSFEAQLRRDLDAGFER